MYETRANVSDKEDIIRGLETKHRVLSRSEAWKGIEIEDSRPYRLEQGQIHSQMLKRLFECYVITLSNDSSIGLRLDKRLINNLDKKETYRPLIIHSDNYRSDNQKVPEKLGSVKHSLSLNLKIKSRFRSKPVRE